MGFSDGMRDFFSGRSKQKKENTKTLKNLADKWSKERKQKESEVGEKVVPAESISILLFRDTKKLATEPRVYSSEAFDKFVPVVKAGDRYFNIFDLEEVDFDDPNFESLKRVGYDIKDFKFIGVEDVKIKSELNSNIHTSINLINFVERDGEDTSLFHLITNNHPDFITNLSENYIRLKNLRKVCEDITKKYEQEYFEYLNKVPGDTIRNEAFKLIEELKERKSKRKEPIKLGVTPADHSITITKLDCSEDSYVDTDSLLLIPFYEKGKTPGENVALFRYCCTSYDYKDRFDHPVYLFERNGKYYEINSLIEIPIIDGKLIFPDSMVTLQQAGVKINNWQAQDIVPIRLEYTPYTKDGTPYFSFKNSKFAHYGLFNKNISGEDVKSEKKIKLKDLRTITKLIDERQEKNYRGWVQTYRKQEPKTIDDLSRKMYKFDNYFPDEVPTM